MTAPAARPSLATAFLVAAAWVAVLWWIKVLDHALGWNLTALGVRPQEPLGLIGVLAAPLLHGSFEHLLANSGAALILGTLLWYGYPRSRFAVFALLWLGSGLGVWLTGRPATHIGASGVTHGLMFFLFVSGMLRRDRRSMAFAMIAFFLYGGMLWGIFPTEEEVSFESHFWGAAWGVATALLFRRRDPLPIERRYAWEERPDADDPVIGDQWRAPPPIPPERGVAPVELDDMYDDADGYNDLDFPEEPDEPAAGGPDRDDDFTPKRRRWRARRPR